MIKRFLKAKHWQLFTLMIGIPVIFQIIIMMGMFSEMGSNSNPSISFNYMRLFPLIMLLYLGLLLGWLWSIAIGLQNKIPENIKMKTKKFKVFFFIPVIYVTLIFGFLFSGLIQNGFILSEGIAGVIIPLHLLSMFGIFYTMYFAAKTIKTVELQKEVNFGEFASEFFLLWFYLIGIWIIQPKINKMMEAKNSDEVL